MKDETTPVFALKGTGSALLTHGLSLGAATGAADGALNLKEISAPGAPAADMGTLYLDVTGAKTKLMILFQSGAAQQIAIEP